MSKKCATNVGHSEDYYCHHDYHKPLIQKLQVFFEKKIKKIFVCVSFVIPLVTKSRTNNTEDKKREGGNCPPSRLHNSDIIFDYRCTF